MDLKIDEKEFQKKFLEWEDDYLRTQNEIEDLIGNLDCLKNSGNFQSLALCFLAIHMFNYYVFVIRQVLLSSTLPVFSENKYFTMTLFFNPANSPSVDAMKKYLIIVHTKYSSIDSNVMEKIAENYKTLYKIRNKYAHADTDSPELKGISLSLDMFTEYRENIKELEKLCPKV